MVCLQWPGHGKVAPGTLPEEDSDLTSILQSGRRGCVGFPAGALAHTFLHLLSLLQAMPYSE